MSVIQPLPEYDVEAIRADFPILAKQVHGHPLAFLDNGASAQKPRPVLDAIRHMYEEEYANVHRGAYSLSEAATAAYEASRETVRAFLNARSEREIIYTGNATGAINLVAHSFGATLKPGDEIVITEMEHHSNIVPWQLLRDRTGIVLKACPVLDDGSLDKDAMRSLITEKTKLVALAHVSNVLGTVNPVAEIGQWAHAVGAKILIDGSQAVQHMPVDVQALDCDFYVFTGHKLYGPTGIGVLYGREAVLDAMPPFLGGGDMISSVSIEKSTWADLPAKFEAGTPPIVQAVGLAAAVDYVTKVGLDRIAAHEHRLLNQAMQRLAAVDGLTLVGTAPGKASVISFTMKAAHPHDVATVIDRYGVCVRAGHHCAEPLMARLGIVGTARASFGMYSTADEVERLASALDKVNRLFG